MLIDFLSAPSWLYLITSVHCIFKNQLYCNQYAVHYCY